MRVTLKLHFSGSVLRDWECRIVANTSAFQAEDAGSIPVIPSIRTSLWIQRILARPGRIWGGVFAVLAGFCRFGVTGGGKPHASTRISKVWLATYCQ